MWYRGLSHIPFPQACPVYQPQNFPQGAEFSWDFPIFYLLVQNEWSVLRKNTIRVM